MIKGLFDIKVVSGKMSRQHDITTHLHTSPSSDPEQFYQGSCYSIDNHLIFDAGIPPNTPNKNIVSIIYKPKFFMLSSFLFRTEQAKHAYQTILCIDTDNKMQVKNNTLYRGWKSGLLGDCSLFLLCAIGACLGFYGVANTPYSTPVNTLLACTVIFLVLLGIEYFAKFILFASASKMLKRYFIDNDLYRGENIVIDMPLQIQSTNYDNPLHLGRIELFKANEMLIQNQASAARRKKNLSSTDTNL